MTTDSERGRGNDLATDAVECSGTKMSHCLDGIVCKQTFAQTLKRRKEHPALHGDHAE